jgi:hypothetical protein
MRILVKVRFKLFTIRFNVLTSTCARYRFFVYFLPRPVVRWFHAFSSIYLHCQYCWTRIIAKDASNLSTSFSKLLGRLQSKNFFSILHLMIRPSRDSGKPNHSSPPTPHDEEPPKVLGPSSDKHLKPPSPIVLNLPVRPGTLSRFESAYSPAHM